MAQQAKETSEAADAVARLLTIGGQLSGKLRRRLLSCGAAAIDPLIAILRDESLPEDESARGYARAHAVRVLTETRDPRAVRAIVETLAGATGSVRRAIVREAPHLDATAIGIALGVLERSPDETQREAILDLLCRTGHRDDRILAALLKALNEDLDVAMLFGRYGDSAAIVPLLQKYDRIDQGRIRGLVANATLLDIADSVVTLGGDLGVERRMRRDRIRDALEIVEEWRWAEHHTIDLPPSTIAPDEVQRRVDALVAAGDLPPRELIYALVECGEAAVSSLLRALRHLERYERGLVAMVLGYFGDAPTGPVLDELQTPQDADHRRQLIDILSDTGTRSDRVFDALASYLIHDLVDGAGFLAAYGDVRALPHLREAVDRARRDGATDESLEVLLSAVVMLGGTLEPSDLAWLERIGSEPEETDYETEREDVEGEAEELPALQAPIRRTEPKIGRNDPCFCGSGKKYKKCHAAAQ